MQWSRSWVLFPPKTSSICGLFLVVLLLLSAACTSGGVQSTSAPTLTLIPSTPTNTPLPPTITPTRVAGIRPEALSTSVPRYLSSLDSPEDQRLAGLAASDLLDSTEANPLLLQLLVFEPWDNVDGLCLNDEDATPGYRVVYQLQDRIFDYLVSDTDTLTLCQEADIREIDSGLRLLIDPVAADLVVLAKARVGREADVEPDEVEVDEIVPRTWQDTSLGCPEVDETYREQRIDGYFIRLLANDRWYQLHTDFERATLCASGPIDELEAVFDPDAEVTPESTPEVEITPESTAEATSEVELEN